MVNIAYSTAVFLVTVVIILVDVHSSFHHIHVIKNQLNLFINKRRLAMKYLVSFVVMLLLVVFNLSAQDKPTKDLNEKRGMREVVQERDEQGAESVERGGSSQSGTRKSQSSVGTSDGAGYSAGQNKGKKLTGDVDAAEAAGRTSRGGGAGLQKGAASVSSGGEGYSAGQNKGKKLIGDVDAAEAAGRTSRGGDAGTAGSARGGAVSSGGSSDEGAAAQSSGDNSSGLLRNKKKGTANTNIGKGENKAKKADAIDDEGSVGGGKKSPVGD